MNGPLLVDYIAERGLEEVRHPSNASSTGALISCVLLIPTQVLCKLEGSYRPLEELATRIKLTMMKVTHCALPSCSVWGSELPYLSSQNESSWVLYNLAALYWRIVGDGQQAIKCLKLALHVSSPTNKVVCRHGDCL